MSWYDHIPTDSRIGSTAASTSRYILQAALEGRTGTDDRFRECRDCGSTLSAQHTCPRCGSEEIAEYDIE